MVVALLRYSIQLLTTCRHLQQVSVCCRYGGFSFGEVNQVAGTDVNWTTIDDNVLVLSNDLNKFFKSVGLDWSSVRDYSWSKLEPANETLYPRPVNETINLKAILSGLEVRTNVKVRKTCKF